MRTLREPASRIVGIVLSRECHKAAIFMFWVPQVFAVRSQSLSRNLLLVVFKKLDEPRLSIRAKTLQTVDTPTTTSRMRFPTLAPLRRKARSRSSGEQAIQPSRRWLREFSSGRFDDNEFRRGEAAREKEKGESDEQGSEKSAAAPRGRKGGQAVPATRASESEFRAARA